MRLARLESQVAELNEGARETVRVSSRLGTLEKQVDRFTGSLEGFLRQIRIDDSLRLVPEHQRLASVRREDLDVDDMPIDLDVDSAAMVEELESSTMDDVSRLASPAAPTATTPSEAPEDPRMDDPTRLHALESGSGPGTQVIRPSGDVEMGPPPTPPVPTVNLIPPTPQNSQDAAGQPAPTLPQVPAPDPIRPPLPSTRPPSPADPIPPPRLGMGRSRSPLPSQLAAQLRASTSRSTSNRLSPAEGPQTRSRSRSRPPE
jgi:hypothetical protein